MFQKSCTVTFSNCVRHYSRCLERVALTVFVSAGVFFLAFSESVCASCELRLVEFGIIYMYIYGYVVIFILLFFYGHSWIWFIMILSTIGIAMLYLWILIIFLVYFCGVLGSLSFVSLVNFLGFLSSSVSSLHIGLVRFFAFAWVLLRRCLGYLFVIVLGFLSVIDLCGSFFLCFFAVGLVTGRDS